MVKFTAGLIGFVAGVVPAVVGLFVATESLRKKKTGDVDFVEIALLDALPADGAPRMFRVITDKDDAWNLHLDVPIGSVFLVRAADRPDEVIAYNAICPHLGCMVVSQPGDSFLCPCHNSEFNPNGSVRPMNKENQPTVSPRGLDRLEARIEGDSIQVRYRDFQAGIKDQVPVL